MSISSLSAAIPKTLKASEYERNESTFLPTPSSYIIRKELTLSSLDTFTHPLKSYKRDRALYFFSHKALIIRSFTESSHSFEIREGINKPTSATALVEGIPIQRFKGALYFFYDPEKISLLAAYKIDALTSSSDWDSIAGLKKGNYGREHPEKAGLILRDFAKEPADHPLDPIVAKIKKTYQKVKQHGSDRYLMKYPEAIEHPRALRWNELIIMRQREFPTKETILGYGICPSLDEKLRSETIERIHQIDPTLPRLTYRIEDGLLCEDPS